MPPSSSSSWTPSPASTRYECALPVQLPDGIRNIKMLPIRQFYWLGKVIYKFIATNEWEIACKESHQLHSLTSSNPAAVLALQKRSSCREVKASNESHQSHSLEQRGGNGHLLACAWFSVCAQIQFSPPRLGSDTTSSGLSLPMSVNLTKTIVHRQPDLDSQSLAETLPGWLWVCQIDSTTFTQSVIHWSSHEAQPWSLMGIAWIPPTHHTHIYHLPSVRKRSHGETDISTE